MALSPAISISSVNTGGTTDPTAIIIDDISTGSDSAIASRSIALYTVANALLVPAIPWVYPTPNPITVNPLTTDIALNVIVTWLNSAGAVLYTASAIVAFTGFGEQFWYSLTQTESSSPGILQDINYQNYKGTLRNYLDGAVQSISVGQNLGNSQAQILKEIYLVANSNIYY
jgi:hypothetical protein